MIASKLPTPASYDSAAGTKTQKLEKEREILNIVRLIWSNEEKLVAKEKKKVGCCCMSWGSKEVKRRMMGTNEGRFLSQNDPTFSPFSFV